MIIELLSAIINGLSVFFLFTDFIRCEVTLGGRQYRVGNGKEYFDQYSCQSCVCMNGNGTYLCEKRSNCHPVSTNVSSASNCTMNGQTYKHGDLIDSECEKCRCNDGGLFCTYRRKTCSNATDNDQSPCKLCRKNTFNPVCGPDGQTYPSECHAVNCIGIPPLLLHEGSCSGNVSKFCHDHVVSESLLA